jgi:hypothetical protein
MIWGIGIQVATLMPRGELLGQRLLVSGVLIVEGLTGACSLSGLWRSAESRINLGLEGSLFFSVWVRATFGV